MKNQSKFYGRVCYLGGADHQRLDVQGTLFEGEVSFAANGV